MKPYYEHAGITIYHGDCREILPQLEAGYVQCCVTSPPYWGLRDYGHEMQVGLEGTPEAYRDALLGVFGEIRRVLSDDGTLWLNIGDSYCSTAPGTKMAGNSATSTLVRHARLDAQDAERAKNTRPPTPNGCKPKDMVGVPWMMAFALREGGWYLRSDVIWRKPACMPESVTDRPSRSHEHVFLLSKSAIYFYNADEARAPLKESSLKRLGQDIEGQTGSTRVPGKTNGNMKAARFGGSRKSEINDQTRLASGNEWQQDPEDGANWRDVWSIAHEGFDGAHFAVMPQELALRCVTAGTQIGATVIDPFCGIGTTIVAARKQHCRAIGIEIEEKYCEIAAKRLSQEVFQFEETK